MVPHLSLLVPISEQRRLFPNIPNIGPCEAEMKHPLLQLAFILDNARFILRRNMRDDSTTRVVAGPFRDFTSCAARNRRLDWVVIIVVCHIDIKAMAQRAALRMPSFKVQKAKLGWSAN
jgi:hypothetical protein